jgi:hypothetical protein
MSSSAGGTSRRDDAVAKPFPHGGIIQPSWTPPSAASWRDGFVDARFTPAEVTEWERLVAGGMEREAATAEMLRRRSLFSALEQLQAKQMGSGLVIRRYLLRRRDWLVWLLRPDAKLPKRWWS